MSSTNPQSLQPGSETNNDYSASSTTQATAGGEPRLVLMDDDFATRIEVERDSLSGRERKTFFGTVNDTGDKIYITIPLDSTPSAFIAKVSNDILDGAAIKEVLATFPPAPQPDPPPAPPTPEPTDITNDNVPLDQRLVYMVDDKSGAVVYSLGTDQEKELVDGFVINDTKGEPDPTSGKPQKKAARDPNVSTSDLVEFYGVPAIMNHNAYINLNAAGGKGNNKFLIDRENQPRYYDTSNGDLGGNGSNLGPAKTPTTNNIINWSNLERNRYKFPYKYQDFVFCKFWQKIPNNYMVTLRRYPYPVNDQVSSAEEVRNELPLDRLMPIATMITFMGEESANKLSTIVGPIETGLNWKELKADVWDVSTSIQPASVNDPAPGLSKALGFFSGGAAGAKTQQAPQTPVDPYTNGPYVNKILGPINVIDKVKIREKGLVFKHEIKLTFEYSLRSIGGINTKAAAMDIIGNIMVMCSASASFWGGMNRKVPTAGQGAVDPFLGGMAGRSAWMRGDVGGFFSAVKDQFSSILSNASDFFNKLTADPIGGLQAIAEKGASEFMKLNTTAARSQSTGIHSLLTGQDTGEWHLQVGSPLNPIMMIGNLICTGVTLTFNDELGPDDFPTELKAEIKLEHARPRDRDDIESMFNAGGGRLYALPKGYESNTYSSQAANNAEENGSAGNTQKGVNANEAGRGGNGSRRALVTGNVVDRTQRPDIVGGPVAYEQLYSPARIAKAPLVRSTYVSLYGMGAAAGAQDVNPATPAEGQGQN
jgi:hypothetical protein